MKTITSIHNEAIKEFLRLKDKKTRTEEGKFLIEGYHLIEEAQKSGRLTTVLLTNPDDQIEGIENFLVTPDILKKMSSTITPQNIVGIATIEPNFSFRYDRYLIVDGIQDPGNLGTIIRNALGFGVQAVILSEDSVDYLNEKVVRSTQGALFELAFCTMNLETAIRGIQKQGINVYATMLEDAEDVRNVEFGNQFAIVLGNEGRGIRKEVSDLANIKITIPMNPQLESLNVGVASGILLYETIRNKNR